MISSFYGLFFYFQDVTERDVKNNLFVQQRDRQVMATKVLSKHVASDLGLVEARLEGLSNSIYLQQGDLASDKTKTLVHANFLNLDDIVDHFFVVNKNNTMTIDISTKGAKTLVGTDVLQRRHVVQVEKTLKPVFSNGYVGLDGKTRIGIIYPIINAQTGKYLGLVGATIPIVQFLSNYENIYNIESRFLVAYDKNEELHSYSKDTPVRKEFFCKRCSSVLS